MAVAKKNRKVPKTKSDLLKVTVIVARGANNRVATAEVVWKDGIEPSQYALEEAIHDYVSAAHAPYTIKSFVVELEKPELELTQEQVDTKFWDRVLTFVSRAERRAQEVKVEEAEAAARKNTRGAPKGEVVKAKKGKPTKKTSKTSKKG